MEADAAVEAQPNAGRAPTAAWKAHRAFHSFHSPRSTEVGDLDGRIRSAANRRPSSSAAPGVCRPSLRGPSLNGAVGVERASARRPQSSAARRPVRRARARPSRGRQRRSRSLVAASSPPSSVAAPAVLPAVRCRPSPLPASVAGGPLRGPLPAVRCRRPLPQSVAASVARRSVVGGPLPAVRCRRPASGPLPAVRCRLTPARRDWTPIPKGSANNSRRLRRRRAERGDGGGGGN